MRNRRCVVVFVDLILFLSVQAAPKKRADNIVVEMQCKDTKTMPFLLLFSVSFLFCFSSLSFCSVHAETLLLHSRVLSASRNELWWWRFSSLLFAFLALVLAVFVALFVSDDPPTRLRLFALPLLVLVITGNKKSTQTARYHLLLISSLSAVLYPRFRRAAEAALVTPAHLRKSFETLYAHELLSDEEE
jgi:hypothetical protein